MGPCFLTIFSTSNIEQATEFLSFFHGQIIHCCFYTCQLADTGLWVLCGAQICIFKNNFSQRFFKYNVGLLSLILKLRFKSYQKIYFRFFLFFKMLSIDNKINPYWGGGREIFSDSVFWTEYILYIYTYKAACPSGFQIPVSGFRFPSRFEIW